MKKYEIAYIVSPTVEGDDLKAVVDNFNKILVDKGAEVVKTDYLGCNELAYQIEDFKKGHYYVLEVNSTHEANQEFDRIAKINENVIRHIIISL